MKTKESKHILKCSIALEKYPVNIYYKTKSLMIFSLYFFPFFQINFRKKGIPVYYLVDMSDVERVYLINCLFINTRSAADIDVFVFEFPKCGVERMV